MKAGVSVSDVERAEPIPVGDFIEAELEKRGWSHRVAAKRIGGNVLLDERWLDLLCCRAVWDEHPDIVFTDDEADSLEALLGVPAEKLLAIHQTWRQFHGLYDD